MAASKGVNTLQGETQPPCIGLTSIALPEAKSPQLGECSQTGVSTRNVPLRTSKKDGVLRWFVLRTTYGREKKAYEYITSHGGTAFYPTITTEKVINGKKKQVEVSRFPNIFFVYGTEEDVKRFVYDNVNLPYLRFYYKHTHVGSQIEKAPMIVPANQIKTLHIICQNDVEHDVVVLPKEIKKFKNGDKVRVIEGHFKGVEGIVARFCGQQRVGIVIDGLLTAATAYVPNAFLETLS